MIQNRRWSWVIFLIIAGIAVMLISTARIERSKKLAQERGDRKEAEEMAFMKNIDINQMLGDWSAHYNDGAGAVTKTIHIQNCTYEGNYIVVIEGYIEVSKDSNTDVYGSYEFTGTVNYYGHPDMKYMPIEINATNTIKASDTVQKVSLEGRFRGVDIELRRSTEIIDSQIFRRE